MSSGERRILDERLEAYLDDRLSGEEKAEFETQLAADAETARQIELQRHIEHRIRQTYAPPEVLPVDIEQLLVAADPLETQPELPSKPPSRRSMLVAIGGLAATIACGLFAWQWGRQPQLEPYFRPSPLADIYREVVVAGFRPYYFCEDEERFRLTFAKRQNVPLRLAEMPAGRRMVGLSYLGGLSRDTTAMLCYADEQPIVVFVDRRENDTSKATEDSGRDLHVFRRGLGDLVMYEVTPLESAKIMDFLKVDAVKP